MRPLLPFALCNAFRLVIALAFTSCAAMNAVAQNAPGPFAKTYCVKVEFGKEGEYFKLMTDVSKPMVQVLADNGEFSFRFLLHAAEPHGVDSPCDYILAYFYPGFPPDQKTTMSPIEASAKAHITMKWNDFTTRRDQLSRLRKTEVWKVASVIGGGEPGNYARLDYMKVQPDHNAEWMKMEQETFKPAHQARIDLGVRKGWILNTLMLPGGSSLPYNAVAINIFKDWAAIGEPQRSEDAFKKAHPGQDMNAALAKASKLRDIVSSELYEIVEVVRPHSTTGSRQ